MEVEEACKLFAQVCLGLAYAHEQHVVHRDLKPGNIMLVKGAARTEGCVKVVDFGIAKIISGDGGEAQSLTRTGEIFGSPLYMSPEQCSSDLVDNRSDVYSLGCVLFEALTGAPPHLGNTALSTMMLHQQAQASTLKEASLGKEFPLALEQVVARMLRKSPAERYQNLSTAAHDLSAICRGSISQLIPTVSPSSARPAPRVVSMSAAKFCLVLAVTAATAAVVSSSLTCLLMPKPAALTKGQQDQEVHRNEDTPAFDIPAGSVDLAMTKRAPLDDSLVDMHFDFPKAYSVGSLLGFRIVDTYGPEKDARGSVDVRVPDGLGVMLYLNQACLNDPEKLKHFSAKGISGLKICDSTHKQLISGTKVLKILKIAQAWSDLRCVCLCPSGVTNHDVVDALCELKGLRTLLVGSIDDPEDFASRPLLMQLASFICTKNFDASSILKHLAQSRNLQSLGLWIDSVPAAQIMELQQCPRLENLVVFSAHRSIGSNIVEAITHLKNLKTVMFDNIKLASAQVEMLRLQCPSVSHIVVLGHLYTPQEEETLKQIDERIVFK
jgi:serine/threonine protein kinase